MEIEEDGTIGEVRDTAADADREMGDAVVPEKGISDAAM
jgi:hypothetical protein